MRSWTVVSALISTGIASDRIAGEFYSGRSLDAARLHHPTADYVPLNSIAARRVRTLGVAAEIDTGFENVGFA
jgi:hypothetical protein